MKSLFDFIVKPVNKRYDNEIKIGDKSLITNANTENFRAVSNMAEVVSTPSAYATPIKKGDIIVIHHNVFRSFFDIRGSLARLSASCSVRKRCTASTGPNSSVSTMVRSLRGQSMIVGSK